MLWISVWMAAVCNVPLWREVASAAGQQGTLAAGAFLAAFMVLVTAGNAALLSLLAWRWTLKPAWPAGAHGGLWRLFHAGLRHCD
jgi:lipid A ethanolaminephosphotransferase